MRMEENDANLDLEYKRYLQIMRPYLGQLVDKNAIKLCNAWIQRLTNCSDKEKSMRNKYIFVLCYQLAKGILEDPFLQFPSNVDLPAISEFSDSCSSLSSEHEYVVIDGDKSSTQILYNNCRPMTSETEHQSKDDFDNTCSDKYSMNRLMTPENKISSTTRKQENKLCFAVCSDSCNESQDQYEHRANNLIMRLREIKKQNMLLQLELVALKEESKGKTSCDNLPKVHMATSTYFQIENSSTMKSMKNKLQSIEEDRKNLLHTLASLQEQLENMEEIKRNDIESIEAKYKMEIFKIKTAVRDENKTIYEEKLNQLKEHYESMIKEIKGTTNTEMKNFISTNNETISQKDKIIQDKNRELEEKIEVNKKLQKIEEKLKKELQEKDEIIQEKDNEISNWKSKLEENKANIGSILSKFLEKPHEGASAENNTKFKAQELERRLVKMEKSKSKCIKIYEAKLANLQREKHLTEYSLQLQLVRQRAQIVKEIAEENQGELKTAMDKLEAKYKEIVANVQSTALEKRLQDEMSMNSVIKAACACTQLPGVSVKRNQETFQNCDSEISGRIRNKVGLNKSCDDDSMTEGYCLNSERFGKLLEKVYVPQRDL